MFQNFKEHFGATWISLEELKREQIDVLMQFLEEPPYMRGSETTDKQLGTSRDLYLFLKSNHMKRSNYLAHQVDPVAMQKRLNKLIDVCHQWKKKPKMEFHWIFISFWELNHLRQQLISRRHTGKLHFRHHPDKAGQFLARSEGGDDGQLWKEIAEEVTRMPTGSLK
ncbi:hypothetical protein CK203_012459 [Vitis vinifera]|uniref:Uncharacterized protein n=1 Tax=Vitis vinifera TaxID=29760 RepID=A0A438JKT0_VITVI|nr:hypothetical protein CK203_012459 [Vitis vinifera]